MSIIYARHESSSRISGEIAVSMAQEGILLLVVTGYLDQNAMEQAMSRIRVLPGARGARIVVTNGLRSTGLDMSAKRAGHDVLRLLKTYGVRDVVAASVRPAARMLGVALGLAVGMGFRSFTSYENALSCAKAMMAARR